MSVVSVKKAIKMCKDHWSNDIEQILEELSLGHIDSSTAMMQLACLGFTPQEAVEDILCDVCIDE